MNECNQNEMIADRGKLVAFGFRQTAEGFLYEREILEGQFCLRVTVTENGALHTALTDVLTKEPYTLHLVETANGAFVGSVRAAYRKALEEIESACFRREAFRGASAQELITYVRRTYGDELEYLWAKTPHNAVWRRKDNKKWYAALLIVPKNKISLSGDEAVCIADLRMEKEKIPSAVDGKTIFPGYHMNKAHWITVLLDGTIPSQKLYSLLDESYRLAKAK